MALAKNGTPALTRIHAVAADGKSLIETVVGGLTPRARSDGETRFIPESRQGLPRCRDFAFAYQRHYVWQRTFRIRQRVTYQEYPADYRGAIR